MKQKIAIVMGATSGMGREIAKLFARNGYQVGVAGRRENLLIELKNEEPSIIAYQAIDVNSEDAAHQLQCLIDKLGGLDVYFHSSGIGYQNIPLDATKELSTAATNVVGFTRMVDAAFSYFSHVGHGQIAVISSIAGTKGLGAAPAYSASKAFQSTYIESLSQLATIRKLKIRFTEIRPGFVGTDLLNDGATYPMLMNKASVARKAFHAVCKQRRVVIIDWRYRLLVALWRLVPHRLWTKLPIHT